MDFGCVTPIAIENVQLNRFLRDYCITSTVDCCLVNEPYDKKCDKFGTSREVDINLLNDRRTAIDRSWECLEQFQRKNLPFGAIPPASAVEVEEAINEIGKSVLLLGKSLQMIIIMIF